MKGQPSISLGGKSTVTVADSSLATGFFFGMTSYSKTSQFLIFHGVVANNPWVTPKSRVPSTKFPWFIVGNGLSAAGELNETSCTGNSHAQKCDATPC